MVDSTHILTTANRDLLAQGVGGQLAVQHWEQLTQYLRRALSPRHAALFAEPNPDQDRASIDWYAPGSGPAVPLRDLDPVQRADAEAALAGLVGDIRATAERLRGSAAEGERFLGELLRLALEIPDEGAVRLREGQLLLAPWGHVAAGAGAGRELLVRLVPAPLPPMAILGPPPPPPAPARRVWPWLLALLFVLLALLALLWILWRDPFGWFAVPEAQCLPPDVQVAALSELRDAEAQEGALRAELARIVAEAGQRRLQCQPPPAPPPEPVRTPEPPRQEPPPPEPVRPPPPPPPPEPPREPPRNTDLDRAQREGGRQGRMQVILGWDDRNDLDLFVICPNGQRINFRNRLACGGSLDLDRNAMGGPTTRTPVENIVFEGSPPPGRYRVGVDYFGRRDGASSPYRVTIRQEGQPDRVIRGTAREDVRDQIVGEFTVP